MEKSGDLLNKIDPSLKKDPLFMLKYIAFCMAVRPSLEDDLALEDFANFAKFQLSANYKIPFKSTIWDAYTTEDLVVEFFALKFYKDAEYAREFEGKLTGDYQADMDWMTTQIEKNKEDVDNFIKQEKEFPKEINFSPKDKINGR